jgi:aryl-alcohol dehydrogenase-like predicted oxidoreductase
MAGGRPPAPGPRRRLATLGSRGFVALWGSSTAASLADGLFQVALPLLALTLTRSPGRIAAVTFALTLPWLLRRSPVILPIPGTSSVAHLEENLAAPALRLTDDEFQLLGSM